jgi:uncharacterized protein involved in type VI secretion and phage assembly
MNADGQLWEVRCSDVADDQLLCSHWHTATEEHCPYEHGQRSARYRREETVSDSVRHCGAHSVQNMVPGRYIVGAKITLVAECCGIFAHPR